MPAATEPRDPGQHGMTMLEVTIMALMMSLLMIVITQSITSLSATRSELRQQAHIGNITTRLARGIEQEVTYAQRTFTNAAEDLAWLQATAIGRSLLQSGHRLPTLTNRGLFEHDPPATAETGDILFLATRGDRVSDLVLDANGEPLAPPVQTFRFVIYAPGQTSTGTDLVRWISDPLANYWDVESITNPTLRSEVWAALYQSGLRFAWDPQKPRATGLFAILAAGSVVQLSEQKQLTGGEDPTLSRTLGQRHMRIAANGSLHSIAVPEFANISGTFPGGFEVKVDGGSAGKLVLFRLAVESTLKHQRQVCGELRRMISTQS